MKAGARHKLNVKHDWHFYSWIGDEIDTNYERLNAKSTPEISCTRSATNPVHGSRSSAGRVFSAAEMKETFGFTKIPQLLVEKYRFSPSLVPRLDHQQEEKRALLANEASVAAFNGKLRADNRVSSVVPALRLSLHPKSLKFRHQSSHSPHAEHHGREISIFGLNRLKQFKIPPLSS